MKTYIRFTNKNHMRSCEKCMRLFVLCPNYRFQYFLLLFTVPLIPKEHSPHWAFLQTAQRTG